MTALLASAATDDLRGRLGRLVAEPLALAVVRENWKYSSVVKATALIAGVESPVPASHILGLDQPGVSLHPGVAPSALELELLTARALTCPPSARALLLGACIDRIEIRGSVALPIELRVVDARRPLFIHLRAGASAIVDDRAEGSPTGWTACVLDADASLDYSRLRTDRTTQEWQQLQIVLERGATLRVQHYATGALARRLDAQVLLRGEGASLDLAGCWLADGRTKLDQQWHVEHLAPHTRSRQLHHGIGNDQAATTFRGRIYIDRHCHGVAADLVNRNLALAPGVVCNTKPELEIHSDDVQCSHGATVGQLQEDSMFYLLSRGIDRDEARRLLAAGFLRTCLRGSLAAVAEQALLGVVDHG